MSLPDFSSPAAKGGWSVISYPAAGAAGGSSSYNDRMNALNAERAYGQWKQNQEMSNSDLQLGTSGLNYQNQLNQYQKSLYEQPYWGQEAGLNFGMQQQQLADAQQKNALKQRFADFLLGGGAQGNTSSLFTDAQNLRNQAYAPGVLGRTDANGLGGSLGSLVAQQQDLASPNSQFMQVQQDQGNQQIQNQYLGALRDFRSTASDRSLPPEMVGSLKNDLLKQRLRSSKDLQAQIVADSGNRRQTALGSLSQILQANAQAKQAQDQLNSNLALSEIQGRVGNPEQNAYYSAQLNSDRFKQILDLINGL